MEIHAVACWDHYYPSPDNIEGVFTNYEEASKFLCELQSSHREKGRERDNYDIFTYIVNQAP